MINKYIIENNKLIINNDIKTQDSAIWLDIINMTSSEESMVEETLKIDIPSLEEIAKIEISNRLYIENDAMYATICFPNFNKTIAANYSATFILHKNRLITVRYGDDKNLFNQITSLLNKEGNVHKDGALNFLEILNILIEMISDILGKTGHKIDRINNTIFTSHNQNSNKNTTDYLMILKKIGQNGHLLSRIQESLHSFSRAVNHFKKSPFFNGKKHCNARLDTMLADLHSLYEHASFLSNETSFSLNASLGMINIDQTNIVRIVSVVPLVFLPPTLIASIYGMNFNFMPELKYNMGYPLALLAMLISGWLPYKFCKKMKWL